jgi:predicted nucleic acid-binding protein
MKDRVFLDTNVLVYLYSEDEPDKQAVAIDAMDSYLCVTSTQALNEFCNVCLKKLRMPAEVIGLSIDEISD